MSEQEMTGYPSLDKPWLKYYSEADIHSNRYNCLMIGSECNYCNFDDDETIVDIVDIDMNVRYVK